MPRASAGAGWRREMSNPNSRQSEPKSAPGARVQLIPAHDSATSSVVLTSSARLGGEDTAERAWRGRARC